ncbi:MAG: toxic anion resistance protein [Leptospiraceae bacterium]|nr:toxic anion resistance protein [Leptospiraceae bacterium]MCP5496142.1 toxic anion resistance protein [Leptospiraceae bacterium]
METEVQQLPNDTNAIQLSPEDKKKIEHIKSQINIQDSQTVIQYGVGAQSKISEFSEQVLNDIKSKDSGFAGDILSNLMIKVKDLDVESYSTDKSFLSKIPIIGSLMDSSKKFMAKYDTISVQIDKIIDELHKARITLLNDITLMDKLYQKNLEYFKDLNLYILAGEEKLKDLQDNVLPAMKRSVESSNDPVEAQKFQDLSQLVNRFEKKLHDLKLSKMLSLQTGPQIRLIQNGNQVLVEKIQSSILNTIPLWKNQIVISLGLARQKKALEIQREVTATTNELLSRNSEMLKTGSIEIAKESEKGIVEIETLKKINHNLISTIDETLKIQEEGRQKRRQAEVELVKLESDIKNRLLERKNTF